VLASVQGAERELRRLETGVGITGPDALARILESLKLDSKCYPSSAGVFRPSGEFFLCAKLGATAPLAISCVDIKKLEELSGDYGMFRRDHFKDTSPKVHYS